VRQISPVCAIMTTALVAVILTMAVVPMSAQDVPSHVQTSVISCSSFDYRTNLNLFDSLVAYALGISVNVSQRNFDGADASLAKYVDIVHEFNKLDVKNPEDIRLINTIGLSSEDYRQLIRNATQYTTLYNRQTALIASDPSSAESLQNTMELQRISSRLNSLKSTTEARNKDIYQNALANGLDAAKVSAISAVLDTSINQIISQVSNATNAVFKDVHTTLAADRGNGTYLDVIRFTGRVQVGSTGLPNSSVALAMDNASVATIVTDATGNYDYAYTIEHVPTGMHTVVASAEVPTIPLTLSNSSELSVDVTAATVTNTVTSTSGKTSLLSGYTVKGMLTAEDKPLKNVPLSLFVDDHVVARTDTDSEGKYTFTYSVGIPEYFTATTIRPSNHSAYTLFEPGDFPLNSAKSDLYAMVVDSTESYAVLIGAIVVALVPAFAYLRVRAMPREAADVTSTARVEESSYRDYDTLELLPPEALEQERIERPEAISGIDDVITGAGDAAEAGNFNGAVITVYAGALRALSETGKVVITPDMTHWEALSAIELGIPEVSTHMHTLTYLFEIASYSGKPTAREHVTVALHELTAIHTMISGRGGGM
jgi:hypothetical protein